MCSCSTHVNCILGDGGDDDNFETRALGRKYACVFGILCVWFVACILVIHISPLSTTKRNKKVVRWFGKRA